VFTARYGLSPYITQIGLVLKELIQPYAPQIKIRGFLQATQSIPITNTDQLMLFREMTAAFCESHTKRRPTYIVRGKLSFFLSAHVENSTHKLCFRVSIV
jgi:hypothetical protein